MKTTLSVEQSVKKQFARLFVASDWKLFKHMAEYYLRRAVFLRTADIDVDQKLLIRNSQKRLFIGIGTELLLKAIYLKHGFQINSLKSKQPNALLFPFTPKQSYRFKLLKDKTYMLDDLINKIHRVPALQGTTHITRGLKIAKVFRNKEGHVVVRNHRFDASNYRDIESSLVVLYSKAFDEVLQVRFSFAKDERGNWKVVQSKSISNRINTK